MLSQLILVFLVIAACSASDVGADLSKLATEEERELALFGGRCAERLSKYQASGCDVETTAWIDEIDSYDGPLFDSLRNVVESVDDADFSLVATNKPKRGSLRALLPVRGILRDARGLSPAESNLESSLGATELVATRFTDQIADLFGGLNLQTIVDIIVFAVQLFLAIQGGPVTLIVFVLNQIVKYVTNNSRNALVMSLVPNFVDGNCMSALMRCEFNDMVSKTVPALIAEASQLSSSEGEANP